MKPDKLQPGDEIRVIAPSKSLGIVSAAVKELACMRLEELGLKVTFGAHAEEMDLFSSSSIDSRLEDLHDAFADRNVKAILAAIGGFNCNQLLSYLDYDLISRNPKILCGYSDITALGNAIYAKTGLITYSGPQFSSFGMKKGLEYTISGFRACLMQTGKVDVLPSPEWSDDRWYLDQESRTFFANPGYLPINEGKASGTIVGGNLCTLNLLQGTPFMPSLRDTILFLEDDADVSPETFDRDLQSLLHQADFPLVKGIVIGRFQRASNMTPEKLMAIIRSKRELLQIPVVAEADLGHTTPMFTFPIGGKAELEITHGRVRLSIEM